MTFKLNPLFFLILFVFFVLGFIKEIIIVFILVFLHEVCHFLVAKVLNYNIYKIEIFPFGGVAEYKGLLEMKPLSEFFVAIAGPVFNLFLVIIFYFLDLNNNLGSLLIKYNLIIAIFNLIPILPLDGGRVLRAIIVHKFGFIKGTKIALKISQIAAFIAILISINILIFNKANIWLLLISFFIYASLIKEKNQYIYKFIQYLSKVKIVENDLKRKKISLHALNENNKLKEAIDCIIPGDYNIFYILNYNREITKIITENKLIDYYFNTAKDSVKLGEL
ncbi:MAG: M50 family metallopeptidase [Bacillota bacterium]